MKSSIDVVCSIIRDQQNRILCVQRGQGSLKGKWEFAGGKVEEGETPQQACERELLEELDDKGWQFGRPSNHKLLVFSQHENRPVELIEIDFFGPIS